ncbi:MAG: Flp family type IVb pilin [Croceibacterium sp.]
MPGLLQRLRRDRSGATAVEYALIAGIIVVAIAAAVGAVGTQLIALFGNVTAAFPA